MNDSPFVSLRGCKRCSRGSKCVNPKQIMGVGIGGWLPNTPYAFDFVDNAPNNDTLADMCRVCVAELKREKHSEYQQHYKKAHADKVRELQRQWRTANPDRAREHQRRYKEAHADKLREYDRRYGEAHPEARRANRQRRRAREKNAPGSFTAADVRAIYAAQGGLCAYCGDPVGAEYELDHYIPLSKDGSNYPDNLRIACPFCNRSKGDKLPSEWTSPKLLAKQKGGA